MYHARFYHWGMARHLAARDVDKLKTKLVNEVNCPADWFGDVTQSNPNQLVVLPVFCYAIYGIDQVNFSDK